MYQHWSKKLLIFFLLFSSCVCYSQITPSSSTIIEVDTILNITKSNLPVNTTFFIKVPQSHSKRFLAGYMKREGSKKEFKGPLVAKEEENHKYLRINPLYAYDEYEFLVVEKPSDKEIGTLMSIAYDLKVGTSNDLKELQKRYEEIFTKAPTPKFKKSSHYSSYLSFTEFVKFVNTTQINGLSQENIVLLKGIFEDIPKSGSSYLEGNKFGLSQEIEELMQKLRNDSSNYVNTVLKKNKVFPALANLNLVIHNPDMYDSVKYGKIPLDVSIYSGSTRKEINAKSKLENVQKSLNLLNLISNQLHYFYLPASINDSPLLIYISKYHEEIDSLRAGLIGLEQKIKENPKIFKYFYFTGNTLGTNYQTRIGQVIEPTIGLTYINTLGTNKVIGDINAFRPFYGFTINLFPTDERIELRPLKSRVSHSIVLGVTFSEGLESDFRYTNLFGSHNLLIGYNYKINHVIGFTAGGVIIGQYNPNPYIEERGIMFVPSLSLSIDFQINTLLGPALTLLTGSVK